MPAGYKYVLLRIAGLDDGDTPVYDAATGRFVAMPYSGDGPGGSDAPAVFDARPMTMNALPDDEAELVITGNPSGAVWYHPDIFEGTFTRKVVRLKVDPPVDGSGMFYVLIPPHPSGDDIAVVKTVGGANQGVLAMSAASQGGQVQVVGYPGAAWIGNMIAGQDPSVGDGSAETALYVDHWHGSEEDMDTPTELGDLTVYEEDLSEVTATSVTYKIKAGLGVYVTDLPVATREIVIQIASPDALELGSDGTIEEPLLLGFSDDALMLGTVGAFSSDNKAVLKVRLTPFVLDAGKVYYTAHQEYPVNLNEGTL